MAIEKEAPLIEMHSVWGELKFKRLAGSEQFRKEIPKLFDLANAEILMTTGLSHEFYNDSAVKNALCNAIAREVKIRIIVDGRKEDRDITSELSNINWMKEKIKNRQIEIKKCEREIKHIMVVDKRHSRLEDTHALTVREDYQYKNKIFYDDPFAKYLVDGFNAIWKDDCDDIGLSEENKL